MNTGHKRRVFRLPLGGLMLMLGIALANAEDISSRSDKGLIVAAVRDGVVWVHATAPAGGGWVNCGFAFPGTVTIRASVRWVDEGSSEFGFPIPEGAKACMIQMHDKLNREGMCPISGGVCEPKAKGVLTGHDGCFCRTRQYDCVGWIHFNKQ